MESIIKLLMAGGATIIVLLAASIISLTVIIERYFYYLTRSRKKRAGFMADIKKVLKKNNVDEVLKMCKKADTPFANVVHAGLVFAGHGEKEVSNNMERTIVIETNLLEQYTSGRVTNALSASFGRVLTARPGRQGELAVRFTF